MTRALHPRIEDVAKHLHQIRPVHDPFGADVPDDRRSRSESWVDNTEEKASDVNLASHILRDAYGKRVEVAVIVTNDSDLAEPVRVVAQEIGLPVGLLSAHQFHSRELRQYATFIKRIRRGDLAACQFPKTLTDRKGTFAKPSGW